MKKLLPLLIIAVVVFVAVRHLNLFEPAPAKAYREYRRAETEYELQNPGIPDLPTSSLARWKMTIENIKVEGDSAFFTATEHAVILPEQASLSHTTKSMRKYEVEMLNEGGQWSVYSENIVDEAMETYEDRKQ